MRPTEPGSLDEARARRHVKFDGTINLGHLISVTVMVLAGVTAWNSMDKRLVVLEEARKVQTERDSTQDGMVRERMFDINQALNKIDSRLDRIGDRLNSQTGKESK